MPEITPTDGNANVSTLNTIINQVVATVNKLSNQIGQSQSNYERNNDELMEVKRMITDFIMKINGLPLQNQEDIEDIQKQLAEISNTIVRITNSIENIQKDLEPIEEDVKYLKDNMGIILDFKEDYETTQCESDQKRKILWSRVWEVLKPVAIIFSAAGMAFMLYYLGKLFMYLSQLLQNTILK